VNFKDTSETVTDPSRILCEGSYSMGSYEDSMEFSNLDRLIFIGSLMWFIHWTTKVFEVTVNFILQLQNT
jgi:hypothetical protein